MVASIAQRQPVKWFIALGIMWLALAAMLLIYQWLSPTVEVRWETATELETAGFNLYRGVSREDISTLVNREGVVASKGGALSGAAYTYTDNSVEAGRTYYYLIEEIEYDGGINRYVEDIFTYDVPYVTPLTAVLAVASLIIGLALIVTGVKEERNL